MKGIRPVTAALLLVCLLAGCGGVAAVSMPPAPDPAAALAARGGYSLRAGVLYAGSPEDYGPALTLDYLNQSLAVNLETEALNIAAAPELSAFDLLILDESLLEPGLSPSERSDIEAFAAGGGGVLCPNGFSALFPREFFGAASFAALGAYPETLTLPPASPELERLQGLIYDYHSVYGSFMDADRLRARDYGVGMKPDTAIPLAEDGKGLCLFALNRYGDGWVLFTNPLLPNSYSGGAFSLAVKDADQASFSNTTASCNQLFYSEFAAFLARRRYGFSLSRVFGSYGAPGMSWEIHYEDITAYQNNSLAIFSDICEEYRQPLSFTLVRNTYTWFQQAETLSYALNRGGPGEIDFALDRAESAYSSGTHVACGGEWLQLNALQNCGSYFADSPGENYRLYPALTDYDGDGKVDAFCGSADGRVYYYRGLGFSGLDGRLVMEPPRLVEGPAVYAYSAPEVCDLNGDGEPDLLVGGADGLMYWFPGEGDLRFGSGALLLDTDIPGQCLPRAGDLNGDGVPDLAVGSDQGILLFYYGQETAEGLRFSTDLMWSFSRRCADLGLGKWLSPEIADFDADGRADLALGVFDGYVALLPGDGMGDFSFSGFVTAEDLNYKGNANLKFGTYCTPRFLDLDGDGALDLLCGSEEYGVAYPIDSPYFPFREELQSQIDFAKEKGWYMGAHYLSGVYFSADREAWELSAQREALGTYGLTALKGVNQHTWHLSALDPAQSLRAIYDAGFLWESGYEPAGALGQTPQVAAENTIALPFFLTEEGERTLLVQNCSVLLYRGEEWTDLHGKYGMPVFAYYHCDHIYRGDGDARRSAETVNRFRGKFPYNFVKEDQLMYSVAAAYNLGVSAEAAGAGILLRPLALDRDFPLYDPAFQSAAGVRVDFAEGVAFDVDAPVWRREGGSLYVGLDRPVTLIPSGTAAGVHLTRVNIPAELETSEAGAALRFLGDGLMEAAVSGRASTEDPGWTVTERNGETVFSKFGGGETLHIRFGA